MRIKILFLSLFVLAICCFAEEKCDIIITQKAERIEAVITEITPVEIKYHKFSNPTGPQFVLYTTDVVAVIYKNGEVQMFQSQEVDKSTNPIVTNPANLSYESIYLPQKNGEWQNFIDDMNLITPFVLLNYHKLYVFPIQITSSDEIDEQEYSYSQYKKALQQLDDNFCTIYNKLGVQNHIEVVENAKESESKDSNSLLLKITLLRLEPSNWATRVSTIRISGQIIEASSGEVLLSFKQQRLSSRDVKKVDVCQIIVQEIASDVANMLLKFVEHY